ncbi:hypothetical protein [Lysinibacillus fusiformis]|uniref:hypothetical protein n=1 Tax=Lysinibacillus fusiformis TaxID=28031 RepID=UPI003CFCDB18
MTLNAGQVPTGSEWDDEFLAGAVIARGRRITSSSAATGTTAVAVLRIDNVPLEAGRLYRVHTSSLLPDGTTSTDVCRVQIHYNSSGTATTASGLMLGAVQEMQIGNVTNSSGMDIETTYAPSANETGSFLLAFRLVQGTGSTILFADGTTITIDIYITDCGVDPGDTGTDL